MKCSIDGYVSAGVTGSLMMNGQPGASMRRASFLPIFRRSIAGASRWNCSTSAAHIDDGLRLQLQLHLYQQQLKVLQVPEVPPPHLQPLPIFAIPPLNSALLLHLLQASRLLTPGIRLGPLSCRSSRLTSRISNRCSKTHLARHAAEDKPAIQEGELLHRWSHGKLAP